MIFTDRTDAGRRLAEVLATDPDLARTERTAVLAVPRGGLPVALEVAARLGVPLDVAVARALRAPHDPDVSFGAVAADGHVEIDKAAVDRLRLGLAEVEAEVDDRRHRIDVLIAPLRKVIDPVDLTDASVIVVDDGIASGTTARLACDMARRAGAAEVILAVPVAAADAEEHLQGAADRIIVLTSPPEFLAVSQAYQAYPALRDEDVLALLTPGTLVAG